MQQPVELATNPRNGCIQRGSKVRYVTKMSRRRDNPDVAPARHCYCELPRIYLLGSRLNKRSEGHLTREGCRAKGPWDMERRRSATRSIHNNCVALAIL